MPSPPLTEIRLKQNVQRMLARRFFLRFHVALIALWTFGVGLLTTRGLFALGVESMPVRYPLAVLTAYLGFLLAVRVWLWYVGVETRNDGHGSLELPTGSGDSSAHGAHSELPFRPGGGQFGGGGASGDYVIDPSLKAELSPSLHPLDSVGEVGGSAAHGLLEGAAGAAEGAIPLFLIVLLIGALVLVFGAGAYLVVDAPAMLAEAAFEAMLAAGLVRATHRLDDPDWSAAVVRRTWLPATGILLLSFCFAVGVHLYRPEVQTVVELLRSL